MSKLKHETELLKEALRIGMIYAEKRGAAKFEASDSANEKIEYIYKLLVHDKLIQPLANEQHDIVHMKHNLALWMARQLPAGHRLLQ